VHVRSVNEAYHQQDHLSLVHTGDYSRRKRWLKTWPKTAIAENGDYYRSKRRQFVGVFVYSGAMDCRRCEKKKR